MALDLSVAERAGLELAPRMLAPGRTLDETLADIAALTAELFECRYALVALFDDDQTFGPIGSHGLSEDEAEAIDAKPSGHGILRELLSEERLLRIDDVDQHPTAEGFPVGHPPMTRFLGTRLDGTDGPLGLLLLADPHDGAPFDEGDEALLRTVRPVAEVAAENAVRLQEARLAQRWSLAAADFMRDLLLGTVDEPLPTLARTALDLAAADDIAILIRVGDRLLQVLHAEGAHEDGIVGATFPYDGSLTEEVITAGEGRVLAEVGDDPRAAPPGAETDIDTFGPAIMLPLRGSDQVRGSVALSRRRGAPRFTQADLRTAQAFADHTTVALELTAARGIRKRLERLKAEHRAARDLHDQVVQRLFATGLSFQQALPGLDGRARERIEAGMLSLEETVQEIRDKILSLRQDSDPEP